jgi:hypothetical protein
MAIILSPYSPNAFIFIKRNLLLGLFSLGVFFQCIMYYTTIVPFDILLKQRVVSHFTTSSIMTTFTLDSSSPNSFMVCGEGRGHQHGQGAIVHTIGVTPYSAEVVSFCSFLYSHHILPIIFSTLRNIPWPILYPKKYSLAIILL